MLLISIFNLYIIYGNTLKLITSVCFLLWFKTYKQAH